MKHNRMHRSCALLLALCLLLALAGCSKPEDASAGISEQAASPLETLVADAVDAIHAQDVEGLLNLIDPTLADPARTVLSLMQTMGRSTEDILATVLQAVLGEDAPQDVAGFCQSLDLRVTAVDERETEATVTADYHAVYGGNSYTGTATIGCVNRDGRWHLASIIL